MRLRFLGASGFRLYRGSHPGTERDWSVGEERQVPAEVGEYLLATFPAVFEAVDVEAAALPAPPVDRALKAPRGRK